MKRTKRFDVRLSAEERRMLRVVAEHEGLSSADWVRQRVREAFNRPLTITATTMGDNSANAAESYEGRRYA